jgi:FtsH-binding integral membrane protein
MRTRAGRRRWVVGLYTSMLGGASGLAVEFWFHGRSIWLLPGTVAMLLALMLWFMLARRAMPAVQGSIFDDPLIDERQRVVRDRAYRQAYHVVSVLAPLSWLIFLLFWALVDGDHFKELVTPRHVMALAFFYTTGVMVLIPSLPSACLAWSEPDDVS